MKSFFNLVICTLVFSLTINNESKSIKIEKNEQDNISIIPDNIIIENDNYSFSKCLNQHFESQTESNEFTQSISECTNSGCCGSLTSRGCNNPYGSCVPNLGGAPRGNQGNSQAACTIVCNGSGDWIYCNGGSDPIEN
jgi:23S rRNA A1618 N6-methylase RlmF